MKKVGSQLPINTASNVPQPQLHSTPVQARYAQARISSLCDEKSNVAVNKPCVPNCAFAVCYLFLSEPCMEESVWAGV